MKQVIEDINVQCRTVDMYVATFYKGDVGWKTLRFHLRGFNVDDDCHAVLLVTRQNRTSFSSDLTVQDGALLYKPTADTTAVVGDLRCQIKVYDEAGWVRTFPEFKMCVNPTLADPENVVPKESVNALTALITKTMSLYKKLKEDLETGAFLGPQGPKGEKGDPGEKGDRGERGETGSGVRILGNYDTEAELSLAHQTGDSGDAYLVSGELFVWDTDACVWTNAGPVQGPKGENGDPGNDGSPGRDGKDGKDGTPGKDGLSPTVTVSDISGGHRITITDADGDKTVDVMDGEPGADGAPGRDGADGAPGQSAYDIAVDNGYIGSEADWLASLRGKDGKDGAPGEPGRDGRDGADGQDGAPGKDGYTPVYGTDYGTPEQIEEIAEQAAEVLEPEVNRIKDNLATKEPLHKILSATLVTGETTLTFTDDAITDNALIYIYANVWGVQPSNVVQSGNTLTLIFDTQSADLGVKVEVR